jgi:hypothetical protein
MIMSKNTPLEEAFKGIADIEPAAEVLGPTKCKHCRTGDICNILTTILACYRLGIQLQVDKCPYYKKDK